MSAGPALVAALLQAPLMVSVYKQPAAAAAASGARSGGSGGGSTATTGRTALLVGTAEIDLAPLLWSSGGSGGSGAGPDEEQQLQQRSVSGSYPLLDGAAASQGGALDHVSGVDVALGGAARRVAGANGR